MKLDTQTWISVRNYTQGLRRGSNQLFSRLARSVSLLLKIFFRNVGVYCARFDQPQQRRSVSVTEPLRIAVTGAAGNIGYSLLFRLAAGDCYGADQPIILQLLEIPPAMGALEGVGMELEDAAFPLLKGIELSDDANVAFKNANQIFLVGSKPRGKGMERKDLIRDNGPIFVGQGKAIEAAAASDVFVLTVGNPCNTNCFIAMRNAPGVPRERFTAMTRLDQNRAVAQLARKSGKDTEDVASMVIWGNHSATQFPDFKNATVGGAAAESVLDRNWLESTFIETIQQRGAAIIKARGSSSAASAASAAVDHMRDAWNGSGERLVSMAVPSSGQYNVPDGTIFSFACRCGGKGSYEIVEGIEFDAFGQAKFAATLKELQDEAEVVADLC